MRDYINNVGVQEMKIADAFTVVEDDGTALTFKKKYKLETISFFRFSNIK